MLLLLQTSWQCIKCCHRNRAPDRLCDECLNLRTVELNQGEAMATPGSCKRETPLLTLPVTDDCPSNPSTTGSHVSDHQFLPNRCRSETDVCARESAGESFDSSPHFTSSQESGFFSADLEDVATPPTTSCSSVGRTEIEEDVTKLNENQAQNKRAEQASSISLNLCIICLSEPKVASLIHGTSGHQACCYQCACQLKRLRKPCPVCRRPIQKVIRNYVV